MCKVWAPSNGDGLKPTALSPSIGGDSRYSLLFDPFPEGPNPFPSVALLIFHEGSLRLLPFIVTVRVRETSSSRGCWGQILGHIRIRNRSESFGRVHVTGGKRFYKLFGNFSNQLFGELKPFKLRENPFKKDSH